jgi:Cu2+-exporting ATPase
VHDLLHAQGLDRYYDLRGGTSGPAALPATTRDLKWLDEIEARIAETRVDNRSNRVVLDVQGLHCAACVWLLQELFRRYEGALGIEVNPALGRVELIVMASFPIADYVREVEAFGYLFGPPLKTQPRASNTLLIRIGISAALALNAMIFALPLDVGLHEGATYHMFRVLAFALGSATVAVGGSVFVRSAWRAARRGVLHLDQPIALGIVLAFGGSAWAFATGREGRGAYFDTVAVFITLMLVGRWLQERVVENNRRYLLASDGADGLLARRIRDGAVEVVRCREIHRGDALLVAPGDVVPVDATLGASRAQCSLDWISGESAPSEFVHGTTIPAGAFNAGSSAITIHAVSDFGDSPLIPLLRASSSRGEDAARATRWWQRLAGIYVVSVLAIAAAGFVAWFATTRDAARAIEVATAILVVTCPCAFGLATPMAYELVQAGLRRSGLFVRSASFLDRATSVRRVVFDKTGTLTTGALKLANASALDALRADERELLYNLVVRSTHPKSVAVRRAFDDAAVRFDPSIDVREYPGCGLACQTARGTYRLGSANWCAPNAVGNAGDLVFARDGVVLASLRTGEQLRSDARAEIAQLTGGGYEVWILSGDEPERVQAMADALGVSRDRAIGGCTPQGKARWLATHDEHDTLMVGDGINDALAVEQAFCSGTPAIDRPFMPARTDFYVVTAGLRPIGLALDAARALARINRRNLGIAVAYNVGAVALCLAGRMSPLLCAVLMPVSSLSILFATTASLSGRSPLWKSSSSRSS